LVIGRSASRPPAQISAGFGFGYDFAVVGLTNAFFNTPDKQQSLKQVLQNLPANPSLPQIVFL
jgi:hypothetical protein